MNIMSEAKSLDLASLQGQVANVVSSLNGVDIQRGYEENLFETNSYYPYNSSTDEDKKQNYINMLKDLDKNQNSFDEEGGIRYNDTIATYYISRNIYYSMMTLGKYINEVQYDSLDISNSTVFINGKDCKTCGSETIEIYKKESFNFGYDMSKLGGISPYKDKFNMDLYNITKKGLSYCEDCNTSNDVLILKHLGENDLKFEKIYDIFDDYKLCKKVEPTSDSVCDGCCECAPRNVSSFDNSYTIFADVLSASSPEFTSNMKALVTDMYKEYYMNEIKHLQSSLVDNNDTDPKIVSELKLLTSEINNEFARYVLDIDDKTISNYLPLQKLIESIKDAIYEYGDKQSTPKTYTIFEDEGASSFTISQLLAEKIDMINSVGNAIHYDLELINRLKSIDEKIKNKSICEKTVRENKFGLAECFSMIENTLLNHDIYRTYNKDVDNPTGEGATKYVLENSLSTELRMELNKIKNNVENYKTVLKDVDYDITSLNNEALDKLEIIEFLRKYVYDTMTIDHNLSDWSETEDLTTYISIQKLDKASAFKRYQSLYSYRNFALIHYKLTTSLAILTIIRYLQCYGYFNETEYKCRSLKNKREYKIQAILESPLPNANYSFSEMAEITRHVFNLKHKTERNKRMISSIDDKTEFDDDEKFGDVMKMLVAIASAYSSSNGGIFVDYSTLISEINTKTNKRFYPLVKSLVYLYPQYFNGSNRKESTLNDKKIHNNNKYEFSVLTNHLNFIAQSIVSNSNYNNNGTLIEGNKQYTIKDFERLLSLIVYYCNSITTHWSDKDEIISKYVENASESSMYGIYGNLINLEDSIFKMGSKKINIIVDETELAFQMNLPEFILEHMTSIMTSSNLTKTTKFVSFITIYVIAAYFSHLYHTNALKPLIKTKN